MEIPEIVPISELRLRQNEILEQVEKAPVVLTHHGKAAVVLVRPERWNRMLRQIEDLDDLVTVLKAELAVARGEEQLVDADIEELKAIAQARTERSKRSERLPT
jgi:prevent-host-death family protein